jgi:hypothetical protein
MNDDNNSINKFDIVNFDATLQYHFLQCRLSKYRQNHKNVDILSSYYITDPIWRHSAALRR